MSSSDQIGVSRERRKTTAATLKFFMANRGKFVAVEQDIEINH